MNSLTVAANQNVGEDREFERQKSIRQGPFLKILNEQFIKQHLQWQKWARASQKEGRSLRWTICGLTSLGFGQSHFDER